VNLRKSAVKVFFLPIILFTIGLPETASVYDGAVVRNVVDGDTLKVFYQGQKDSVRLIGIDTPESRKNKKASSDAGRTGEDIEKIISMGKEATRHIKELVKPGDTIRIEFDVQKRDKYRRLLGYVYLRDGRMLNEEIIKAGYASPMTIPPM
jgi:micrococcal nuclease